MIDVLDMGCVYCLYFGVGLCDFVHEVVVSALESEEYLSEGINVLVLIAGLAVVFDDDFGHTMFDLGYVLLNLFDVVVLCFDMIAELVCVLTDGCEYRF